MTISVVKHGDIIQLKMNSDTRDTRHPIKVALVIDTSYSMDERVESIDEFGNSNTNDGLSILDIVKHASKTIINSLETGDQVAIVKYSTNGVVISTFTSMNASGKIELISKVNDLRTDGQTNIWDGLYKSLELFNDGSNNTYSTILMLTDGQPNINPPRGIVDMLKKYRDGFSGGIYPTINTFGFGNNLDSQLLYNIASEGNGSYGFIPDAGFVGTVFCNIFSNELATIGTGAIVQVETSSAITEENVLGDVKLYKTSWGVDIHIGNIREGQSKTILFKSNTSLDIDRVTFKYTDLETGKEIADTLESSHFTEEITEDFNKELCRGLYIDMLSDILLIGRRDFTECIEGIKPHVSDYSIALLKEITGQVVEAVRGEYWNKWGKHYIPSLKMSHDKQECFNFKDFGMQFYGGALFSKYRDTIENIFITSPPPTPSLQRHNSTRVSGGPVITATPVVNMSRYMNASGGCFSGGTLIHTQSGLKRASTLNKNDVIKYDNKTIYITHVLKFKVAKNYQVVNMGDGLKLSPYHPIIIGGEWKFPIQARAPEDLNEDYVYNFVLNDGHILEAGYDVYECITLAHNIQGNDVLAHEYLGTSRILKDLDSLPMESGKYIIKKIIRDADTGEICGVE